MCRNLFFHVINFVAALKHSPSKRKSLSRPTRVHDDVDNSKCVYVFFYSIVFQMRFAFLIAFI